MDYKSYLGQQMKDPEFRREYEALEPEFSVIQAVIDARKAQDITQEELSRRTGINQADISKLERGGGNPTIKLLKRLASGLDMDLKIEFVPKRQI